MKKYNFLQYLMVFVGISGAFSVLFGAWLAHAGQALPMEQQTRLASALQYQFLHTLALMATIIWYQFKASNYTLLAMFGFVFGILLFSGSLYLKTLLNIDELSQLAPVGGTILAISWIIVAIAGKKSL